MSALRDERDRYYEALTKIDVEVRTIVLNKHDDQARLDRIASIVAAAFGAHEKAKAGRSWERHGDYDG